ncbi:hypothetical protein J2S74_002572 [Evansella vedderi]|uniref:DUF4397 domain-containing protein n=1 Tax=Evansella vedderi TaxID=38282 RepID=A0ABT9ZYJ9_9BACI|nr:DUF4397 domain-containing protein [Evansella vedderi]MDQ0255190.1 hypothetical protein [Evansella vedderi]
MKKIIITLGFILSLTLLFHSSAFADVQGTHIRLLHASPDAPNVDVYFKKENIFSEIPFKEISEYVNMPAGSYKIKVFPEGADPKKEKPIIKEKLKLKDNQFYTLAILGQQEEFELLTLTDTVQPNKDSSHIRFVHLSPDTSAVDIVTDEPVVQNLTYTQASDYVELQPSTQDIKINVARQETTIYEIPNLQLMEGANYSIFTLGLFNGEPGLDVVITKDLLK